MLKNDTEDFVYASFWSRVGALIIDGMVQQSICLLIAAGVFFVSAEANTASKMVDVVVFLLCLLYQPLMEGSSYQATLGKIAAGIKVTSINGERISWLQALGRRFAMILSALPLFLGYLLPLFSEKKQALHDMIASTLVLHQRQSYFWRVMAITFVFYAAILASAGFYVAKNLEAWLKSGMATSAVILKEDMTKLQKQNTHVPESVNKNSPIKPYALSEQQYEDLLANKAVNFSPTAEKPTVFPVKPIALELSTFFEGNLTQWLELHIVPEINIGRGGYMMVQIDNVLNNNGIDVYDKDSQMETEFFQKKFTDIQSKESNPMNEIRSINVKAGTKETDIKSVNGVLRLFLPINTQIITLSGADVGKLKNIAPDLQIMVQKFGNGEISYDVMGQGKSRLLKNLYAYNAQGLLLENTGWSSSEDSDKTAFNQQIAGTPSTMELVIADRMLEKNYPFTVKK